MMYIPHSNNVFSQFRVDPLLGPIISDHSLNFNFHQYFQLQEIIHPSATPIYLSLHSSVCLNPQSYPLLWRTSAVSVTVGCDLNTKVQFYSWPGGRRRGRFSWECCRAATWIALKERLRYAPTMNVASGPEWCEWAGMEIWTLPMAVWIKIKFYPLIFHYCTTMFY